MSPGEIDLTAPVVARTDIMIAADSQRIWDMLLDVPNWTAWFPEIKSARIEDAAAAGAVIAWTTRGMTIRSRLTVVTPPQVLAWDGSDGAVRGLHRWSLEALEGGTRVRNEESISGGDVSAGEQSSQLTRFLGDWNHALKAQCELHDGETR